MDRLNARSILVVEDEALIALDVAPCVEDVGCSVIRPVMTVADAMLRIEATSPDAVLDVSLHAKKSLGIMDALEDERVPFVILTGYCNPPAPTRFRKGQSGNPAVGPGAGTIYCRMTPCLDKWWLSAKTGSKLLLVRLRPFFCSSRRAGWRATGTLRERQWRRSNRQDGLVIKETDRTT